ncbi:hypothetical protein RQP53_10495 [Paucibacter sp. APW11]|uniref:Uncharacterized protein n=1 Tax=Roseateles aquae TaxID=3077235 RepID=A0ABU3PAZ3_9BURK|nr:hypothetical protein [Paucibacter sp. APW11]MDT8999695.1 hypothetical protein [Paucibacter sp. APW11]
MNASDQESNVKGGGTLTKDIQTVNAVNASAGTAPSWPADPMRPALMGLIGKDVALYGLSGDRPAVVHVESAGSGVIRAVLKASGEEVCIAERYVLLIQGTSPRSRKAFLSRSKGCEFILRLASAQAVMAC